MVPYSNPGYVFEALDHKKKEKVALKRIEKVGRTLSREYEILFDLKNCPHVIKILVFSDHEGLLLLQNKRKKACPEHNI